jgi:ribosomal protein L11 methyltransferase
MTRHTLRHATALETIRIEVPAEALEAYEAALTEACGTIGFFLDEETGIWTVEGVKDRGANEAELAAGLALAAMVTGFTAEVTRDETPADGWLARTMSTFPEQLVGRRFAVRGTHLETPTAAGRIAITLDAGVAFGSGEHGSTRGCLRALERVAYRRPTRILDLGTGSGILAMAATRLLHRPSLATDIDPWSVRTARDNARLNHLAPMMRFLRADGWTSPVLTRNAPYDLIFANILMAPLLRLAVALSRLAAPHGRVVLSGLLPAHANAILAIYRAQGLVLVRRFPLEGWMTLVLKRG